MRREKEAIQWSSSQTFGLATILEKESPMSLFSFLQQRAPRGEMRRAMRPWFSMAEAGLLHERTRSRLGKLSRREPDRQYPKRMFVVCLKASGFEKRIVRDRIKESNSLGDDLRRRDERGMRWMSRGGLKVMRRRC